MIFQSIRIKEGLVERSFCFTKGANLIFSHENSKGKTTLLRFMLYSLGYNIPNTRKIKFDRCEVVSQILAASVVIPTTLSKLQLVEKKEHTYCLTNYMICIK